MKRKLSIVLIALILTMVLIPLASVSAYSGGLLNGLNMNYGSTLDATSTSTVLTDGNITNSFSLEPFSSGSSQKYIFYKFATPRTISSYQFAGANVGTFNMRFYDADKNILNTVSSLVRTGTKTSITPVSNVTYVALLNFDTSIQNANEFDVFEEINYSGGLLDGLTLTRSNDGATFTTATDNNTSTLVQLTGQNDTPMNNRGDIILPAASNVTSLRYKADAATATIYAYTASDVLVGSLAAGSYAANGSTIAVSWSNVKRITILKEGNGSEYIYEINAYGTAPDTTPPPVPTGLAGTAASGNTALTWDAVTAPSDFAGYHVYVDNVKVTTSPITVTNYNAVVTNNENHTFEVTSVDDSGNESAKSNQVTSYFDTVSPLAPIGLTSNPSADGTTLLNWTDNSEPDLAGYNVYQDGSTKKNGSLLVPSEYLLTGLSQNITYSFTVTAVDTAGNESGQSSSVTYYFDSAAPAAPTNLTGVVGTYDVDLSWTDSVSSDVTGYNIYQDGIKVNTGLVTTNEYTVTGLDAETEYSFTVRAVDDASNESVNSNTLEILTNDVPLTPPAVPASVGTKVLSQAIQLNWSASLTAASYNVYVDGVKHNTTPIYDTEYYVSPLVNGTSYNLQVTAVNTAGESAKTSAMNVTPSENALPYISYTYNLENVADAVGSWFAGYWLILVFALSIPLSFAVGRKVKDLF